MLRDCKPIGLTAFEGQRRHRKQALVGKLFGYQEARHQRGAHSRDRGLGNHRELLHARPPIGRGLRHSLMGEPVTPGPGPGGLVQQRGALQCRRPVETEAPVLVVDHDGNIVGLGPDTPIGSAQSVFVYAKDCAA